MPRAYTEARNRVFYTRPPAADGNGIETLPGALDVRPFRYRVGAQNFMNAIRIHSYGGPQALLYEEAPRPQNSNSSV